MGKPAARAALDLFLSSCLMLFLELACIRWFASTVVFLTFFTNIVLLAAFLGMAVGCLAASRRLNLMTAVIPVLLVAVALAFAVLFVYTRFGNVMIDVGGQGSPQQIYFGTEYRARDVSRFVVPIEVVAGMFFAVIAILFAGLGQVMGRRFNLLGDRLAAYTLNVTGSLAGISLFTVLSYLRTPPEVWFAIALGLCLYFTPRRTAVQVVAALATLVLLAAGSRLRTEPSRPEAEQVVWSPYYKIQYAKDSGVITTNNIGHQTIGDIEGGGIGYVLPHLLNRDAGGAPFGDVLVIGAGSGNDVSAALRYGATRVDAVEIDPAILDLGRANHPNHPYQNPRVVTHVDDGRSFVRQSPRRYDLIVYALVDSLVLHSGYSTVRLESFLFTKEAFEDIKAHLNPNGVFVAYNYYRQGWLIGRLKTMITDVFGAEPIVMPLPYTPRIGPEDPAPNIEFILSGRSDRLTAIRNQLAAQFFWANTSPGQNDGVNGFRPEPPEGGAQPQSWHRIRPAQIDVRTRELTPTDDWPFLYLRDPVIPAVTLRGLAVVAVLSIGLLLALAPVRRVQPNWRMFFLGAGFMLLETTTVVHLALLFGSTWIVNAIVIFAILVLILASNLFVLLARPARLWPFYLLLAASLGAGIAIPLTSLLTLPAVPRLVASMTLVALPIFFAGVVFASAFRDSRQPDVDFGSNIGGAVLGGLAEPLSLMIGFRYLLVVALGFYALSAMLARPASSP